MESMQSMGFSYQEARNAVRVANAVSSIEFANGIDISHWQGIMNFDKSVSAGDLFVAMKATESTSFVDSQLANNAINSQGKLYRSPYHFYREVNAITQANHFYNTAKSYEWELPPLLDFEILGATKSNVKATLLEIENLFGKKPMIYTSAYFWNQLGVTDWAKDYDLWVASWGSSLTPFLPNAWSTWRFWQWTSTGNGSLHGAQSQYIDLNRFNGTKSDLDLWVGVETPPPPDPTDKYVKITANTLNLRSSPTSSIDNKIGHTYKDKVWRVTETATDELGRLWYKGEAWLASWWTEEL